MSEKNGYVKLGKAITDHQHEIRLSVWTGERDHPSNFGCDIPQEGVSVEEGLRLVANSLLESQYFARGIALIVVASLIGDGETNKIAAVASLFGAVEQWLGEMADILGQKEIKPEGGDIKLESLSELESVFQKIVREIEAL